MSTTTKLNDTKGATFHTEAILSSLSSYTLCEGVCFEAKDAKIKYELKQENLLNSFVFLNQYIFNCTH